MLPGRYVLDCYSTLTRRAAWSAPLDHERLAAPALGAVVVLAIVLRLVPTLFVPSTNWADEIFQSTEQAHRLVYGTGLIPWEFQLGARSWLLPGSIAVFMELARLLGDGPDYYLPVISVGTAALGSAPVVCCFLWCRRSFGLTGALIAAAAVAMAPELVYFGARTLSEVLAGHLLIVAIYLLEPGYPLTSRRRLFISGTLLGLVLVVRVQLLPALLAAALWTYWRSPKGRGPAVLVGAAVALSLAAVLDSVTLGSPLASLWRYLSYNLYYGVSSSFGVEAWDYYLRVEIGIWRGAAPLLLVLALLGAWRMPLILVTACAILAAHCGIAHKEYRFIYPALVPIMVLAGAGSAQLADWLAHRLSRTIGMAIAAPVCLASALSAWAIISWSVWTSPILAGLRHSAHETLLAARYVARGPAPCGIGLYGLGSHAWAAYGGYTYLHHPAPLYWPKDELALIAAAGGFDTLLYTKAPSPALGFNTVQCIGEVCIARRHGGCRWIPPEPLPVPEALAEVPAAKAAMLQAPANGADAARGR